MVIEWRDCERGKERERKGILWSNTNLESLSSPFSCVQMVKLFDGLFQYVLSKTVYFESLTLSDLILSLIPLFPSLVTCLVVKHGMCKRRTVTISERPSLQNLKSSTKISPKTLNRATRPSVQKYPGCFLSFSRCPLDRGIASSDLSWPIRTSCSYLYCHPYKAAQVVSIEHICFKSYQLNPLFGWAEQVAMIALYVFVQ